MGDKTLTEQAPRAAPRFAALLTYVLGYDDLLAGGGHVFRIPRDVPRVVLGRAQDGQTLHRHSAGELRIPDPWMSGAHAALERSGAAIVLVDKGSKNGTFVNGEPVREHTSEGGEPVRGHTLEDGDLIEVGHSLFCFRMVPEALAARLTDGSPVEMGPTESRCPQVVELVDNLGRIAASRDSILLLGETGAGKEIAARMVHDRSDRAQGPYVIVNGGAVPNALFESIFFGHKKGAFTSASADRVGDIVRADGGTLFLDEVANIDAAGQAKLLRVLEDGKVMPVGGVERKVDVRWITATNVDLFAEDCPFRADLRERLATFVGRIPPLRDRREDLGLLSRHFIEEIRAELAPRRPWPAAGSPVTSAGRVAITPHAARKLFGGSFPGNVRELRARLRAAVRLSAGGRIDEQHVPDREVTGGPQVSRVDRMPEAPFLAALLEATEGNVTRAAAQIGKDPAQLRRWLKKRGVEPSGYRR